MKSSLTKWLFQSTAIAIGFVTFIGTSAASATPSSIHGQSEPSGSVAAQSFQANTKLDPDTFAGPVLIATPSGEVYADVKAGELRAVAREIRANAQKGQIDQNNSVTPNASCGVWLNTVAGPATWWYSGDGCAVFGYTGYQRQYAWANTSSVTICAKARGFNSSGVETFYYLGCIAGGSSRAPSVPWGNTLAYTGMQGLSVSGLTAGYQWRT